MKILAKFYEQIGRNWPKCQFLGQNGHILVKKGPKNGQKDFCQNFHWVIIVIDQMQFKYAKLVKPYEQIERNCPKCQFLGQIGHFFYQKQVKKGQNILFSEL